MSGLIIGGYIGIMFYGILLSLSYRGFIEPKIRNSILGKLTGIILIGSLSAVLGLFLFKMGWQVAIPTIISLLVGFLIKLPQRNKKILPP